MVGMREVGEDVSEQSRTLLYIVTLLEEEQGKKKHIQNVNRTKQF